MFVWKAVLAYPLLFKYSTVPMRSLYLSLIISALSNYFFLTEEEKELRNIFLLFS